jgi:hypothetical protein
MSSTKQRSFFSDMDVWLIIAPGSRMGVSIDLLQVEQSVGREVSDVYPGRGLSVTERLRARLRSVTQTTDEGPLAQAQRAIEIAPVGH